MLKIAIPGWFHSLQPPHFALFDRLLDHAPQPLLALLVLPFPGFDISATRAMLSSLPLISEVHALPRHSRIDADAMARLGFTAIAICDPNPFPIDLPWPIVSAVPPRGGNFVLQLAQPHPDIAVAQSVFMRRYSPQTFSMDPVPDSIVQSALSAAQRSPSAGNLQAYSVVYITNPALRARLGESAVRQEIILEGAGIFAFVVEPEISAQKYRDRGRRLYALQDATIACVHMQLALEAHGVQSRWIGAFREGDMQRLLGLGDRPVAGLLVFGYGMPRRSPSLRREISEYVSVVDGHQRESEL
jgi:nitroreductase